MNDLDNDNKRNTFKWETEGLNENATFYYNREEKILDLKNKLDNLNIIYVRSPTATGKTSIVHLINKSDEFNKNIT